MKPGAGGPVRFDPTIGADDPGAFSVADDAAQRRWTAALHRAVSFGTVLTVVNPWSVSTWNAGRTGNPIIESPDARVIEATTHNGMAHLAEFVQRDRDHMLVGIAVA